MKNPDNDFPDEYFQNCVVLRLGDHVGILHKWDEVKSSLRNI